MRLQIAQRAAHHGVGDGAPDRSGHESTGVDAQVELDPRAPVALVLEAPLAREVAEVPAQVLAPEPARRLVDLSQLVADLLELGVDLELNDRAAALFVAFEHLDVADCALPLGQALVVRQRLVAAPRRGGDLGGLALAVVGHGRSAARVGRLETAALAPAGSQARLRSEIERELVPQPALEALTDPAGRLAAARAGDVAFEQALLEQRRERAAPRQHHDLRVAIEGPGVEVHRPEADDV